MLNMPSSFILQHGLHAHVTNVAHIAHHVKALTSVIAATTAKPHYSSCLRFICVSICHSLHKFAHTYYHKGFASQLCCVQCPETAKAFHLPLFLIICFLPLLLHTDLAHPLCGLSLLLGIPSCSCSCQLSFLSSFCSFPLCISLPSPLLVCLKSA